MIITLRVTIYWLWLKGLVILLGDYSPCYPPMFILCLKLQPPLILGQYSR